MGGRLFPQARLFRFGPFELDVRAGELRKHGIRIKVRDQSVQILLMLLDQPGEVMLRDEIRFRLWPNNTVVEFDHGINAAIQKLRDALGESADSPRYVETVARRGYRFLGEVERVGEPEPESTSAAVPVDAADLAGKLLSHYRIHSKLGEGGTGVVYRAEDLRLGRQVALKFVAEAAGESPDSVLRRFEREARAASALNHPHICIIHGLENLDGHPAIVMELVEGETLSARLSRGPLPLSEALQAGVQIAAAMAEAHRKGIVHRDLKPANIMLTKSGLKVLDFGLAKLERAAVAGDETATMAGTVLGTPDYMSPEQAQSRDSDARSDIFSFGVVLYEMLAGRRPFEGQSAASVMAAILERDPPALGDIVPPALERAVRRCLAKNADERWQSSRDLKAELEWIAQAPPADRPALPPAIGSPWKTRTLWIALGTVAALLVALLVARLRETPPEGALTRFSVLPNENTYFGILPNPAVSPDGRQIVYGLYSKGWQLWLRSLEALAAVPLAGTASVAESLPFWSPDGRYIAFFADRKLKRMDLRGPSGPAPPVTLCADLGIARGGTWNREGVIVFSAGGILYRVQDKGGLPVPLTGPHQAGKGNLRYAPWFLPDGRHFLFAEVTQPMPSDRVTIRVGSLDSQETKFLRETGTSAIFAKGHLLFQQGRTLMAQPFDPRSLATTGDAVPVAEQMLTVGNFSASESGLLVYFAGTVPPFDVAWFDRHGKRLSAFDKVEKFINYSMEFSPDLRTFAWAVEEQGNLDIWLYDVARGTRKRFTFDPAREMAAMWSPDGRTIVFSSNRKGHFDLYRRASNESGAEELLFEDNSDKFPTSWSADGKFLLYDRPDVSQKQGEMWALPLAGQQPGNRLQPFLLLQGAGDTARGRFYGKFSPDGRWIVYQTAEGPVQGIFLVPFRGPGEPPRGRIQVSPARGRNPRWRKDGKEIFYLVDRTLVAVPVEIKSGAVVVGEEQQIIGSLTILDYDVSVDGQRFLVVAKSQEAANNPMTVVQNWTAGLKK
jgi:eukaryotic-like serine/threonine-protein kinase